MQKNLDDFVSGRRITRKKLENSHETMYDVLVLLGYILLTCGSANKAAVA